MISVMFSLLVMAIVFCAGCIVGSARLKDVKELQKSVLHPHRYIKRKMAEKKEEKAVEERIQYFNDVLFNIENYDGTGLGQRRVNRGE